MREKTNDLTKVWSWASYLFVRFRVFHFHVIFSLIYCFAGIFFVHQCDCTDYRVYLTLLTLLTREIIIDDLSTYTSKQKNKVSMNNLICKWYSAFVPNCCCNGALIISKSVILSHAISLRCIWCLFSLCVRSQQIQVFNTTLCMCNSSMRDVHFFPSEHQTNDTIFCYIVLCLE